MRIFPNTKFPKAFFLLVALVLGKAHANDVDEKSISCQRALLNHATWYAQHRDQFKGHSFHMIGTERYGDDGLRLVFEIPKKGALRNEGPAPTIGNNILEVVEENPKIAKMLGFEVDRIKGIFKHPDPQTIQRIVKEARESGNKLAPAMGIALYDGPIVPYEIFLENLKNGLFSISIGSPRFTMHDIHIHLFAAMILPKKVVLKIQARAEFIFKLLNNRVLQKNANFIAAVNIQIKHLIETDWDIKTFQIMDSLSPKTITERQKMSFSFHLKKLGTGDRWVAEKIQENLLNKLNQSEQQELQKLISQAKTESLTKEDADEMTDQILNNN